MFDRVLVFVVLAIVLVLFVKGRWRYDLVALMALVTLTSAGTIELDKAFEGFGHPAVITVAAVLVLSRGIRNSGLVDILGVQLDRLSGSLTLQLAGLMGIVIVSSALINNVGAVALLMPVAMKMAERAERPASVYLMPLAFGSLLGGMTSLIGTPPNIIISTFRTQTGADPFGMFDFTPVGAGVALAGMLFIVSVGWRLLPVRPTPSTGAQLSQIGDYLTEMRVGPEAKARGMSIREIEQLPETPITIVAVERAGRRMAAPARYIPVRAGDVILVEGEPEGFETLVEQGLELVGSPSPESLGTDEVAVLEAVVGPGGSADGTTVANLNLRSRYGLNLLAVARQGASLRGRLASTRLRAGDVLLLQGWTDSLGNTLATLGLYPLAEREIRLGHPRRMSKGVIVLGGAVGAAAFGIVPVPIAFLGGAIALVLLGLVTLRESYDAIDWPIIVLLAAMIPIGGALETTGGAQLIADGLVRLSGELPPQVTLLILLVGTMFLSDVINNAAAAVLMAPIAISTAVGLGVDADPYLMAIAIGASSAFLTPIGHQSNTLVLGPGGYRFGDYWRLGLPLEVIVVAVAVPLLLLVWS